MVYRLIRAEEGKKKYKCRLAVVSISLQFLWRSYLRVYDKDCIKLSEDGFLKHLCFYVSAGCEAVDIILMIVSVKSRVRPLDLRTCRTH